MVLFGYVLQLTVNNREFNMSRVLQLVISPHYTNKNIVSERNACYLPICKETLTPHRNSSHCKFFPRAVVSSCVACVIYHSILSNYMNKYLGVQIYLNT